MRRTTILLAAATLVATLAIPSSAGTGITPVRNTARFEFHGGTNGTYHTWAQDTRRNPNHFNVFARGPAGRIRLNDRRTMGFGTGLEGDTVIYQQVNARGTQSNLRIFDLGTGQPRPFPPGKSPNTPAWEYWPSFTGDSDFLTFANDYLLFGRNRFGRPNSPWKIILLNLDTGTKTVLATSTNRCACLFPGQVNGDEVANYATWFRCGDRCKVFRYHIEQERTIRIPKPPRPHDYAPSVDEDGTVYFARSGNACGRNVRLMRSVNGGPPQVIHRLPGGKDVFVRTFAYGDASQTDLLFDRYGCNRDTADVMRLNDAHAATAATASPTISARGPALSGAGPVENREYPGVAPSGSSQ